MVGVRGVSGVLSETELKRRISAARALRGMTQAEMDALGAEDGLDRQELSRTERGELSLTRVRGAVLSRVLALPVEWFSWPCIDALIVSPAPKLDEAGANLMGARRG